MEFTIGQNSTLPLLKLQVVNDGIESYNSMMEFIERSSIFFTMVNTDNGIPKVYTKSAGFVEKIDMDPNASPEYYVYYRFTQQDTSKIGRYEGQFMFINDTGTLVLPIREPLFINIVESYIATDLPYNNCYVLEYNCCVTPLPSPTPTPTREPVISPTPTSTVTPTPTPTLTPTQTPNQPICPHPRYEELIYSTTLHGDFTNDRDRACEALYCLRNTLCNYDGYYDRYFNVNGPTVGSLAFSNETTCYPTNDTGYFIMWLDGSFAVIQFINGVLQNSEYIC
jgi:hypothetical protein